MCIAGKNTFCVPSGSIKIHLILGNKVGVNFTWHAISEWELGHFHRNMKQNYICTPHFESNIMSRTLHCTVYSQRASRSPVVYWLGHPTLVPAMAGLNPIRNPLLPAKAVDHQPSLHLFGMNLWIGNLGEVKLLIVQWSLWRYFDISGPPNICRHWYCLLEACLDLAVASENFEWCIICVE